MPGGSRAATLPAMNDQTSAVASEVPSAHITPMGGLRRSGRVTLRPKTTVVTLIGGVDLDLNDATLPPDGARLTKVALVGGVSVVVPPDVRVEVRGFSLVGGRNVERLRDAPAGGRGLGVHAGVTLRGARGSCGSARGPSSAACASASRVEVPAGDATARALGRP